MTLELILIPIISALSTAGVIYFFLNKNKTEVKSATSIMQPQKIVTDPRDLTRGQKPAISNEEMENARIKASRIVVDAKEEAFQIKQKAEREAKDIRLQITNLETKIEARHEALAKKETDIDREKENLTKLKQTLIDKEAEITKIINDQSDKLETIASLTKEEAKKMLLGNLEKTLDLEVVKKIKEAEEKAQLESDKIAKEILLDAMHNASTDYVAEFTLSKVKLADPDIKGKIIGKDGRNIKAFEDATGVNIDFEDDTNEIRLSSFDSVRREVAKLSLEKLIKDGRIQPARIEEVVAKTTEEIDKMILEAGEYLCNKVGVYNLPKELIKKLGSFKYRTSYGQNMISHTLEETKMGVKIAKELGADVVTTKLACLLHDIGKVITDKEGNHMELAAEYLKRYNLPESVILAVAEHHEDKPSTMPGVIVQIADAISGARPGARYEDFENYVKRITSLEEIAKSFKGVDKAFAISAGRELRVIIMPDQLNDIEAVKLSHDIAEKVEKSQTYPGTVKITVIRELRAISTAK